MLWDNSCVYCYVYYCAIKLERFEAKRRHFQLVKKHTHETEKKENAQDPPLFTPLRREISM